MSLRRSPSPLHVRPQPAPKVGRSERTRAAILNAALDFFWSRSFRDATVSAITASTDVSRSAFYQYFADLHELTEALLDLLKGEIFVVAQPWLTGVGDPVALMAETLEGLVRVAHQRGPLIRAVADAACTDKRYESAWEQFLVAFDDAATARIEADQAQGLIPAFDARPVAIALNRLDAYALIQAFGQHPRRRPAAVREALTRVWTSTLYGAEWIESRSSDLIRT